MNENSPLKAIRQKCLQCSAGQVREVRFCPITDCALHGFRFGHKPKKAAKNGVFTDESTTGREVINESLKSKNP